MHKGPYRKRMKPCEGHPLKDHPLYSTWASMFSRCENPSDPGYRNYGGRGIDVSRRWYCFDTFLADMGPRPEGASIDRINNDKGYSPSNCRWATRSEQMLNRRTFSNNTSGVKGIRQRGNTWIACMDFEGVRYMIGYFKAKSEAAFARSLFEKRFAFDREGAIASLPKDKARHTSSTGVRGVTPHSDGGYTARVTIAGKRIYLGYFKSFEDACNARARAIESRD